MRAALLVLLLLGACRSRVPPEHPTELFAGGGVTAIPELGGAITAGQLFLTTSDRFDLAFELRAAVHGGRDDFFQASAGVRQVGSPGHDRRPLLRYGVTWFRANGDPDPIDRPGDYLGVYLGAGYEWDLSARATLSPEVSIVFAGGEGSIGTDFLPQLALILLFRF